MQNILMNTEMTKAILDCRKVQFREVVKIENDFTFESFGICLKNGDKTAHFSRNGETLRVEPKYQIGETISFMEEIPLPITDVYGSSLYTIAKITNVRVEPLQDITFGDIINEGYPSEVLLHHKILKHKAVTADNAHEKDILNWWIATWNKTALKGYKWENNRYVFVYEFKRVEK